MIGRALKRRGPLVELVVIVVAAISLALATQAFAVKPYQIPSGSMEPTLEIGQRVLVNRFIYDLSNPSIGDIIVFHPPAGADRERCGTRKPAPEACAVPVPTESSQTFIKRVVAGPGDRLRIIHGHPIVNGRSVDGPWAIDPCRSCNLPRAITITPGHYFVMGDNRPRSDDSRFWGPVPRGWIIGEVFLTYWPPDRAGFL